ncbi:MAG: hypothetical protein JW869_06355 [Candidatus Omnitrophica bacterium]|nr:hypothetical protein [Candidatus Omnitrophota bacterium]
MCKRNKHIILSCERGWRGIRELSLFLAGNGLDVYVLIKGYPSREVQKMISPYDKIHNIFIPRKIFSVYLFFYLLANLVFHRVHLFISTSKRVKKGAVAFFKLEPFFVFERPDSYCIEDFEGRQIKPQAIPGSISS